MNNDNPGSHNGYAVPGSDRSFGAEAQRETESVFRRAGGESLDEYLHHINTYLTDLNSRLGVNPSVQPADDPVGGELPETEAPDGGFAFAADASSAAAVPDAGAQPYWAYDDDGAAPPDPAMPDGYDENEFTEAFAGLYEPERVSEDEFPAEAFRFASAQDDYAGSNWQAAVAYPELYPDLDDPAVRGRGRIRRARSRKERVPKVTRDGKSRFSFVTTWINLGVYAGWTVLYYVCLTVRSVMFTGTQTEMASQGVATYSLSISSPLFAVLKLLAYAMPVIVLLWMKGVLSADRKGLPQVDRRLLIAAFAADVIVGIVLVFDVFAAKLIADVNIGDYLSALFSW